MPITTFKEVAKKLGISLDDLVYYHKQGDKCIIEVDLNSTRHTGQLEKNEVDVFGNILAMAEDVGIKDWSLNHDHYLYGTPKRKNKKSKA